VLRRTERLTTSSLACCRGCPRRDPAGWQCKSDHLGGRGCVSRWFELPPHKTRWLTNRTNAPAPVSVDSEEWKARGARSWPQAARRQLLERVPVLDLVLARHQQREDLEICRRLRPAHFRNGLFPVLTEIRSSAQITSSLSDYANPAAFRQGCLVSAICKEAPFKELPGLNAVQQRSSRPLHAKVAPSARLGRKSAHRLYWRAAAAITQPCRVFCPPAAFFSQPSILARATAIALWDRCGLTASGTRNNHGPLIAAASTEALRKMRSTCQALQYEPQPCHRRLYQHHRPGFGHKWH
jgi:hypothetical protein